VARRAGGGASRRGEPLGTSHTQLGRSPRADLQRNELTHLAREPPHLTRTATVLAKTGVRGYSRAMALMDKIKKWLGMGKKKA
jgi:hypothetical protein